MCSSDLKGLGKVLALATEEDQRQNFAEAFRLYQLALEYFMHYLKCTSPAASRLASRAPPGVSHT